MFQLSRLKIVLALIGACVMSSIWSGRASAQVIDCNTAPAGALQAAIDSGQYFIEFTGTCNEFVGIYRDDVYLFGSSANPALNVINGGIDVWGAKRIGVENVTVSGDGVYITGSSYVHLWDSIITDTDYGVYIARNSVVAFDGNTFGPALIDDASLSCVPICVADNSHVRMRSNTVNGAANDPDSGAALSVFRDSSVALRGGNVITNTGTQAAIGVYQDSSVRQDAANVPVTGQINGGVEVWLNSVFDTRQAVISGDSWAYLHSVIRVAGGSAMQINGGIDLGGDSALWVSNPLATINGDVTCADGESSAAGSFAGTGKNLCSGFSSGENDFNGDGKADLLWRNGATGTVVVWLMDGSTRVAAKSIGVVPLVWVIEKVDDYNGDGKSDIFWRNSATGGNIVWLMDGFAKTSKPVPGVPTAWQLQP